MMKVVTAKILCCVLADGTGNAARHQIAPDPTPAVTMKVSLFAFCRRSPAAMSGHLRSVMSTTAGARGQTDFTALTNTACAQPLNPLTRDISWVERLQQGANTGVRT
jgi:hypothetical protein